MNFLHQVHSFYLNLLKPDHNYIKDESDQLLASLKNKFIFWTYLFFIPATMNNYHVIGKNPLTNPNVLLMLGIYTIFLIFCRRFPFKIYKLFGLFILIINPIHYYFNHEKPGSVWTPMIINPILSYYITNSKIVPFLNIIIESILLKHLFIPHLFAKQESFDFFIEKFLENTIALSIIIYMIILGADSQIITFQNAYIKKSIEKEELQKHKILVMSFSHEIRNLINTLTGIIQLCLIEVDPLSNLINYLKEGKYCTEILLHLMNNVLDSGKISINDLEITSSKISLYETLRDTWTLSSELLRKKWITGVMRIANNVPDQLIIDKYRLSQILLNLIGNAVKFTDKGRVDITVEYLPGKDKVTESDFFPDPYEISGEDEGVYFKNMNLCVCGQNYSTYYLGQNIKFPKNKVPFGKGVLKISVQDTGLGIEEKNIPKLFKQFSQLSTGEKKQIGTGLGLFITKNLCSGMKGDIKVFSKINHGTTFVVCVSAEAVETFLPDAPQGPEKAIKKNEINALIVDDETFARNVLSKFVSRLKVKSVDEGMNGNEAYQKYIESHKTGNPINFITMDINMPGCDGKHSASMIRKFERENNKEPAIIIMISANCYQSEIDLCLDKNGGIRADYFLKKPVSFDELFKLIEKCFN